MKTVKLDFYGADTGHNLFCKKTNLKKKRHTYLDTQILKFSLVRDKSNIRIYFARCTSGQRLG